MAEPRRERVPELFEAALRQPPTVRREYLQRACASDLGLLAEVESLLTEYELSGGTEDTPVTHTPPKILEFHVPEASQTMEGPGSIIGAYKLLEQLGAGGMGVVYKAQQQRPIRRMVALKILKPGMDSREVLARFEGERQALAVMSHAHIARIFDAGTTAAGRPYFAMELVDGAYITHYSDAHQFTLRERIELFIPVCHAIQHAHHKGIIHRDIKPSNLLVTQQDNKAVPKVIDFGIAKATQQRLTDMSVATHLGTVVGTLDYMSPEQADMAAHDVDWRSDVYSLGVVLYELLTGSTPFEIARSEQTSYIETLQRIREEEPPRPSTRLNRADVTVAEISARRRSTCAKLSKSLHGELDWIVMKALEKDRSRRYQSADALAQDLQAYLSGEPVQAGPPSAFYHLRKFTHRRRKWLVAGPLVAAATALVGLLIAPVESRLMSGYGPPSDFRVQGKNLIVFDVKGRELWRYAFAAPLAEAEYDPGGKVRYSRFGELIPTGERDLIFAVKPGDMFGMEPPGVVCFTPHGEVRWRFKPGRPVTDGGGALMVPPYSTEGVLLIPGKTPRETRIAVSSSHYQDQPDQVALLDVHGRVVGEYWHPGHLNYLGAADVDGDHRTELLLAGVNNGEHQATLVVLDPLQITGLMTPHEMKDHRFELLGMPAAKEKAVVLFPRSAFSRGQPYTRVSLLRVTKERLLVNVTEGPEAGKYPFLTYELDYGLHAVNISPPGFSTIQAYQELEARGDVDHSFSVECDRLKAGVIVRRPR